MKHKLDIEDIYDIIDADGGVGSMVLSVDCSDIEDSELSILIHKAQNSLHSILEYLNTKGDLHGQAF